MRLTCVPPRASPTNEAHQPRSQASKTRNKTHALALAKIHQSESLGLSKPTNQISCPRQIHQSNLTRQVSVEMMGVTISQAVDSARITDQNQLKPKRGRVSISELISKCEKVSKDRNAHARRRVLFVA